MSLDERERVPLKAPRGYNRRLINIAKLEAQLSKAHKNLNELKPCILIQCTTQCATGKGCGKWWPIMDLIYYQTHWYKEPSGCNEGGYHLMGEGQWVCPHCLHINRLYKSPDIEKLKPYFKGVQDVHD